MSNTTVAAASLANVYKSTLPSGEVVAVKVQRPDVRLQVAADAMLLRSGAAAVEALRDLRGERLVKAAVVDAVDEFMSRLFEEMDFENEARLVREYQAPPPPPPPHPTPPHHHPNPSPPPQVRIWSIPEGHVAAWVPTPDLVTSVCWSPNGRQALAGLFKGQVYFWHIDFAGEGGGTVSSTPQAGGARGASLLPGPSPTVALRYFTQVEARNSAGKFKQGCKVTHHLGGYVGVI